MVRLLGALAAVPLLTSCSETDWRDAETSLGDLQETTPSGLFLRRPD
ncbi:MAG: hypothetical protein ACJZ57_02615 [Candidatus Poriferisodalaceae bacterium]